MKEMVRICDAMKEEQNYINRKFKNNSKVIDMNVRNYFPIGSIKVSTLKCCYGFNHYATRDRIVNHGLVNEECPQCSSKED